MHLSEMMGYRYSAGFPRARDALDAWCGITGEKIPIPSNCCPALLPFASEILPVNPETGLAPCPVQLYGYRQIFHGAKIEIDPLMTGLFGEPFADSCIVSFGYSKTIDIGGGGMFLSNNESLWHEMREFSYFPSLLVEPLTAAVANIHATIMEKKRQYEEIEREFSSFVTRLPDRPIIPWRFVAKESDKLKQSYLREHNYKFSRNYPPLPGVTDPGAIEWGKKVINIWR